MHLPYDEGGRVTLAYAPRPPARHRRAIRRWAWTLAFVAVVGLAAAWVPSAWLRLRLLHDQRRCLAYQPTPGQVVADFAAASNPAVVPAEWVDFCRLYSPPGLRSSGTVFLHGRTSPAGVQWLVAVDLVGGTAAHPSVTAVARSVLPGTPFTRPGGVALVTGASPAGEWTQWDAAGLRVMAGRADPTDLSHFTFDAIEAGQPATYDGWIGSDGAVRIERRPARFTPALPTAAPPHIVAP